MKKILATYLSFLPLLTIFHSLASQNPNSCSWAVIGAGPAGIISVSILIENGVKDVIWIDDEFKVGRLGKYYGNVPSNLKAFRYTTFLQSCDVFRKVQSEAIARIMRFEQQQEPSLQLIIDPLQDITNYLMSCTVTFHGIVKKITRKEDLWNVEFTEHSINAQNVILAIGAFPKTFFYKNIQEIPLDIALDEKKLKSLVTKNDKIIVVGGAHSALLIVKFLSEIGVKKILNIYSKPPKYGMYGGLEGITAYWTKEILEKNPPSNILRMPFDAHVIEEHQSQYDKIIYAFGYQRNPITINGSEELSFDYVSGKILPNLYGIGIAFPAKFITSENETVSLIGVNSFMAYAKKLIPQWIKE